MLGFGWGEVELMPRNTQSIAVIQNSKHLQIR